MSMTGHSIFGIFQHPQAARDAARLLRQAGFSRIWLEPADSHLDADLHVPGPEMEALYSWTPDTAVHGGLEPHGAGGWPSPGAASQWFVVTETDGSDTQIERAVKIIKLHGGHVAET
ncbi:MAG: hypothetical protein LOD85_04880 [Clostridia bacterium]